MAALLLWPGFRPVMAGTGSPRREVFDYTSMSGWPEAPDLTAASVYMIELNSGAVLVDKNSREQSFPASTTKIMTCLLTLENCQLDERITLSHDAIYDIEEGGHHYDFQEGEVLTVDECLRFLMVESVNEIAYALAEHISGSLEAFADLMNQRAKELGAENTNFKNPHGLNDPEHVTTARDMAMIFWGCVQNEQFCYYAGLPSVSGIRGRAVRMEEDFPVFGNHHLMLRSSSDYYDKDVVCGKTGYTSLAGNTLVTYASHGDMDVVCVLMQGGSDRFNDTRLLLDYAWNNFTTRSTADLARELLAQAAEPFTLADSLVPGTSIVFPNSFPFPVLRTLMKTEFSVGEVTDHGTITGTRLWKMGDSVLQREIVEIPYVEETQKPAEPDAGPEAPTLEPYSEPEGILYEDVLGWRLLDLLIIGGLFLLLIILFVVLVWVISTWHQDREEEIEELKAEKEEEKAEKKAEKLRKKAEKEKEKAEKNDRWKFRGH